jgi:hypothetical protein
MVVLDASRRNHPVPRLALWSLGAGIVATVGADLAHGLGHGRYHREVNASTVSGAAVVFTNRRVW